MTDLFLDAPCTPRRFGALQRRTPTASIGKIPMPGFGTTLFNPHRFPQ